MNPTPFPSLIQRFFADHLIAQRNVSPQTIAAYRDTFRLLLRFLSGRLGRPVDELTLKALAPDLMLAFLDDLENRRHNKIRTRNARLAAIRSFMHFVLAETGPDHLDLGQRLLAIPFKRCVKPLIGFLTREEVAAILTDRDELDKQIERVFADSGETIYRTSSGHDLMAQLGQAKPRLLCSLVHKFGRKGVDDFDAFIEELKKQPSPAVGELFVFVDECHRTQTGKLHRTMKAMLPAAVFIGFTGTPLLKADKATSLEVFGGYIHTYKFNEGVEDGVVLDLVYEARDIEQSLGSQGKVDAWFEAKTKGLNGWQKAALREQWGTMQKVLSSRRRCPVARSLSSDGPA